MWYVVYWWSNLAQDTITPWILASDLTITVDSKWWLFPTHNGTTDPDYPCLVEQFDSNNVCTKREMVLVTARTGNQFTVTRSFGSVPWSDSATSQWTTAYSFDEWARFSLINAWEVVSQFYTGLWQVRSWSLNYGEDAWGDDAYVIALDPVLSSYSTGQHLYMKVATSNTWACTADFGPWAKNIKTLDWTDPTTGDIRAWQIVHLVYDGTNLVLQQPHKRIEYYQLAIVDRTTDVSIGDGKYYITFPTALDWRNLVSVHARVITAWTTWTTDIQIHNVTDAVDVLSTKLTIDSGETGSDTAATAAVINTSNDDVDSYDLRRVDVDAVSTTAPKWLIVTLWFQLP